jgi:hypothetical protein
MTALRPLRSEAKRAEFLRLLDEQLRTRDVDVIDAVERATNAVNKQEHHHHAAQKH